MTEKKDAAVKESKVSLEVAEREFEKFTDAMDLDVDPAGMNDEDKASLVDAKRVFIRAVQAGALIVNGDDLPVYTPQRSAITDPITFYEPTGATLMAIDQAKSGADVSKTFKVLAELTKSTPKRFAGMKLNDVKVCTAIMGLFMG